MPHIVVEESEFADVVNVPADGEGASSASMSGNFVQPLANRTRYLHDISAFASYILDAPDIFENEKLALEPRHQLGDFSVSDNAVRVPAPGIYMIIVTGSFRRAIGPGGDFSEVIAVKAVVGSVDVPGGLARGHRWSDYDGDFVPVSVCCTAEITDTDDLISIRSATSTTPISLAVWPGSLVIRRLA